MDLSNIRPVSDVVEVEIKHPVTGDQLYNDDKSKMTITLYASHSKEYKAVVHEQMDKRLAKAQKDKNITIKSSDLEKASLQHLANVTKEWNITYEGTKPDIKKAVKVYEDLFWVKEQLEEALQEGLDFTKA